MKLRNLQSLLLLTVLLSSLGSGIAQATECVQPDRPRDTPVWHNFMTFLKDEYFQGQNFNEFFEGKDRQGQQINARDAALVVGHALGRAAAAVDGVPVRRQAFACIDRGLDQRYGKLFWEAAMFGFGTTMGPGDAYALTQEAAMGMHDARVAELTGVTRTDPAPQVYAAATGGTSTGSGGHTGSWEKLNDPAYGRSSGGYADLEHGIDRPGSDIRTGFPIDSPQACRQACADESQCRAFTYVKPGYQGSHAKCWIKHAVPGQRQSACCVSGVLARGKGSDNDRDDAVDGDSPVLVLDKVTVSRNGRHRERRQRGNDERVYEYTMGEGHLGSTWTYTKGNELISHLRWKYEFTVPPRRLNPGATLPVRLRGELSGHSNCCSWGLGMSYYAGHDANKKIASLTLHQNEMSDVRDNRKINPTAYHLGRWHYGGGATETADGEIRVPKNPRKFAIKASTREGLFVRWDYKLSE